MKKKAIFIAAILSVNFAIGQEEPPMPPMQRDKQDNVESVKIAFITREVDLTPEEAQKFWPVYNQFQNELEHIRKDRRQDKKEYKKEIESLSDAEVEKLVDEDIAFQQRELEIRKKYNSEFKKVLPIKKVARLYRAQNNFRREILRKMGDKHPQSPPPPPLPKKGE